MPFANQSYQINPIAAQPVPPSGVAGSGPGAAAMGILNPAGRARRRGRGNMMAPPGVEIAPIGDSGGSGGVFGTPGVESPRAGGVGGGPSGKTGLHARARSMRRQARGGNMAYAQELQTQLMNAGRPEMAMTMPQIQANIGPGLTTGGWGQTGGIQTQPYLLG